MKTSKQGIDLIKKWEGLRLSAYLDPVGIPTIGYGHIKGVKMGDTITEDDANRMLVEELKEYEGYINKYVTSNITQSQFDALVSFVYNLGPSNLRKSTLLKKVNANPSDPFIAVEFEKWVRAGGQVLLGLVRRRKDEADLYYADLKKKAQ
jgi:lysozyme